MIVSDAQIDIIRERLRASISSAELSKDLLDHICCAMESEIGNGLEFDAALELVLNELAPHGLIAIQMETTLLLNFNKIINMKKFLYTIGALSVMSFVTGWTFAILHLPGATILSIGGFLAFALIFLPLMTKDHFRARKNISSFDKLKYTLGISSAVLVSLSTMFKIFHLEGAHLLLVFGVFVGVIGFLPLAFMAMYRKSVAAV